jgi:GAF domain-containing protein
MTVASTAPAASVSKAVAPADAARALRQMLQSQRAETEALFSLIAGLASTLALSDLLRYVVRLCSELTGCQGVLVYLWDESQQRLVVRGAIEGYEQWIGRFSLALGEGLTGWTALTRQPGIIRENPLADPRFKFVPELRDDRFQSYLTIPICAPDGRLLGVITMHTEAPHEFSDDDLMLMSTVSALIGAAVSNAQLYDFQTRQLQVLRSLAEASRAIVEPGSRERVLERLAAAAGPLVDAESCAVLSLDEGAGRLKLEALWRRRGGPWTPPPATVPAAPFRAWLVGSSEPVIVARREQREVFAQLEPLMSTGRSALLAPMRAGERPVGLLICVGQRAWGFDRDDCALVGLVASQAALVLENARLVDALSERNVLRDFFDALALGEDRDAGVASRARRLGVDLSSPHVVMAAEVSPPSALADPDSLWIGFRQALTAAYPGSLALYRDHTFTALVRLHGGTDLAPLVDQLGRLKGGFESSTGLGLSVGLSRVCLGADAYAEAFEQARQALLMGRALRGGGSVASFDEFGSQWHLMAVAQQSVRDRYQERLQRLMDHDRTRPGDLFRTAQVYLESAGNAKVAAARLGIHRNTLRQRLERIRRLTEVDLDDVDHWFDIMMAIRILRLREVLR